MKYRYGLKGYRPASSGGVQDPELGTWVDTQGNYIFYEDQALVQDSGESHPRNASGIPSLNSDATIYLRDKGRITLFQPGDSVQVTYPDESHADGEVLFAREIDAALLVRYL